MKMHRSVIKLMIIFIVKCPDTIGNQFLGLKIASLSQPVLLLCGISTDFVSITMVPSVNPMESPGIIQKTGQV